ncbi:hypothetical protein Vqi01_36140 [Micromonospora qiuiae]|uniref:Uncharacterized protein n=2 Tax=Micromonospora qiuiae TaxID=502268 RepID=A0ABQ4JE47_9ACTN|nr:hypothetical protein Vqi01_36140 [Micromonospora qiuiae]
MRVRIALRVAPADRRDVQPLAVWLRQEANRILEALLEAEEDGAVANLATETDATDNSITIEAIVSSDDEKTAKELLASLLAPFTSPEADRAVGGAVKYEVIDIWALPLRSGL